MKQDLRRREVVSFMDEVIRNGGFLARLGYQPGWLVECGFDFIVVELLEDEVPKSSAFLMGGGKRQGEIDDEIRGFFYFILFEGS